MHTSQHFTLDHAICAQVSESVTFPIDAVKTRMQFSKSGHDGFTNVLVRTVKVDGVGALYRRVQSTLFVCGCVCGVLQWCWCWSGGQRVHSVSVACVVGFSPCTSCDALHTTHSLVVSNTRKKKSSCWQAWRSIPVHMHCDWLLQRAAASCDAPLCVHGCARVLVRGHPGLALTCFGPRRRG
jgi:hypothetical protein